MIFMNWRVMNALKVILLFIFAGILVSCDKEENVEIESPSEDKNKCVVEVYYSYQEAQDKKYPDINAKVYVYYDTPMTDFMGADSLGNGVFDKRGLILKPEQIFVIDVDGIITIERLYLDKDVTIMIESHRMKPVCVFQVFSPLNPLTKIVVNFTINDLFSQTFSRKQEDCIFC